MSNIRRITLAEARRLHEAGETKTNWDAPPGPDLPNEFWEEAELIAPEDWEKRSVHLKLEPEVFAYFKAGGKGHLTRMQNVLKAYVKAQQKRAS
jgi:uncharacterized protein (DUF4415 family)